MGHAFPSNTSVGKAWGTLVVLTVATCFAFSPSQSMAGFITISGTASYDSALGTLPVTLFGGLTVNANDDLTFAIQVDDTTVDADPSPNIGKYGAGITQVDLTVGASSTTLFPDTLGFGGPGLFDPLTADLAIGNDVAGVDSIFVNVDIFDLGTFDFDAFGLTMQGPATIFTSDQLLPYFGGTGIVDVADFSTVDADLSRVGFLGSTGASYSVTSFDPGTGSAAIPEPGSFAVGALLASVLCGLGYYRRRGKK